MINIKNIIFATFALSGCAQSGDSEVAHFIIENNVCYYQFDKTKRFLPEEFITAIETTSQSEILDAAAKVDKYVSVSEVTTPRFCPNKQGSDSYVVFFSVADEYYSGGRVVLTFIENELTSVETFLGVRK